MAIQAGDFTASQLAQALLKADRMFSDDMQKADFEANVDVWKAIKAEQNANVSILEDGEKERDVKVHWINSCATVVEDCDADDCDLDGAELGTDSKVYSMTQCKQSKFTVDEMVQRTNVYNMEDIVAKGFLKADRALSNTIAANAVAKIEAFKGTNQVSDGIGTPNGVSGDTDIAAADWTERLFAYLYRVGIQNKFSNPFILSGTNLWEDQLVALLAEANANGKGAANLYKLMRKYFDLFNIDPTNAPDLKTYLINRGAIAFASKVHYGRIPTKYIEQHRYIIPSRNLPGVEFDVFYTNRCSGNTIKHDFKLVAKYDYFLNPLGCDDTRTGVLAFNKS
mgnify:CR=1 FL=1